MRSRWAPAFGVLLLSGSLAEAGTVVTGRDQARLRLPPGLRVEAYTNSGYRLEVGAGEARVTSSALALTHDTEFVSPADVATVSPGAVAQLARSLTMGAETRGEASFRILAWLSRNLRYALERDSPQDAESVLARRSGYCTGIARLAVALLQSVAIEAREVPGWISDNGGTYHRWIEIYDPAVGWTFSDPLRFHGFVPATYVRLAAESVTNAVAESGALIARQQRLAGIDDESSAAPGVREVVSRQRGGASLRIAVAGAFSGDAVLEGAGLRRSREFSAGEALFANLPAGSYLLVVSLRGVAVLARQVELRGRVRAEMLFPAIGLPLRGPRAVMVAEESGR